MEIRARYLLVGAVVLGLLAGLAAFSVWLVRADVDRTLARYESAFAAAVSGLRRGGQVLYRGIPVGRVARIRIDPDNVQRVLVTIEIDRSTPIMTDTVATLEMQSITGIAYVLLRGGTQGAARLDPDARPRPQIASEPSSLERVFEDTPALLGRAVAVAERLSRLLEDDNLAAIGRTLRNLEAFTATLATRSAEIDALLAGAGDVAVQVDAVSAESRALIGDLRRLSANLDQNVAAVAGEFTNTLGTLHGTVGRVDRLIGDLHQPLDDFAGTGLYELTQLVGETRQLIAALSRITKEFERDPAGFLIGSRGGFEAQ
jgi:phospholipid/cholesterol/gamma-HCH transport system substrate-binding protein